MAGLNGLSVGIITVGGLLVYAGIRGVSPLQALRDVSTGKPVPIPNAPGKLELTANASAGGNVVAVKALAAAANFSGDKYATAASFRREKDGYSDCSSFVDKAFHAVGVAKPDGRIAWPTTTDFGTAPAWKTIPMADAQPGDIAVMPGHHMAFVTNAGGTEGLGQQNPTTNVHAGSMNQLFYGLSPFGSIIYRTYVGTG